MPDLDLNGIGRHFGGVNALDDVELQIRQGEFVAIVGPSGGGKSTLLNIIGLLDRPDTGVCRIDAVDASTMRDDERARVRSTTFAFIFQSFHLLDRRPVIDSVELGLLYRGIGAAERRLRAVRALDAVGLDDRAHDLASRLSGGQRQRVAIARAIAMEAPIIVADEPTGNLDSRTSGDIIGLLRSRQQAGSTVIIVTHDRDVAARADRILHLTDGRITADTAAMAGPSPGPQLRTAAGTPSRLRCVAAVRDAAASLLARTARSIGLGLMVATAVALATTTTGLGTSANAQVSERFDRHANRSFTATWDVLTPSDDGEVAVTNVAGGDAASVLRSVRSISGVESAALLEDRGTIAVRATPARPEQQVRLTGVAGVDAGVLGADVRWLQPTPSLTTEAILIGGRLADQLGIGSGAAGLRLQVGDEDRPVAGILDDAGADPMLLASIVVATGTPDLEPPNRVRLLVRTDPGGAPQVAEQLPFAIDPTSIDKIRVQAPVDPSTLRAEVQSDVQTTLVAFTGVAILAAIAALTNAMVLAVLERRAEFGLRRALGARRTHIRTAVLLEAGLLGVGGGAAGLVIGMTAILGIAIGRGWAPVLDPSAAPVALICGLAVGLLGGLAAAWRAARLDPQEALRL